MWERERGWKQCGNEREGKRGWRRQCGERESCEQNDKEKKNEEDEIVWVVLREKERHGGREACVTMDGK